MMMNGINDVKMVYLWSVGWNTHGCDGSGVIVLPLSARLGIVTRSWSCSKCGDSVDVPYRSGRPIESGDIVRLSLNYSFYNVIEDFRFDRDSSGSLLSSKYGETTPLFTDLEYITNVVKNEAFEFNGGFGWEGFEFKIWGKRIKAKRLSWSKFEVSIEKVRKVSQV